MALSKYALGANSAMESETRQLNLKSYIQKSTPETFNIQTCYQQVFKKQDHFDKNNMVSIATLENYIKALASANKDEALDKNVLSIAQKEANLLAKLRRQAVAEEKQLKQDYLNEYGVVLGDRSLD